MNFVIAPYRSNSKSSTKISDWRGDYLFWHGENLVAARPLGSALIEQGLLSNTQELEIIVSCGKGLDLSSTLGIKKPDGWVVLDCAQAPAETAFVTSTEYFGLSCSLGILKLLVTFPMPSMLFWTRDSAPTIDAYFSSVCKARSASAMVRSGLGHAEMREAWIEQLTATGVDQNTILMV